jgi:hypothetical protein
MTEKDFCCGPFMLSVTQRRRNHLSMESFNPDVPNQTSSPLFDIV